MNHQEPIYSARAEEIYQRFEQLLNSLQNADVHQARTLLKEERDSYQILMARLTDESQNGKSPALRSIAGNLLQYFQSMQKLAEGALVDDMQSEETDIMEAEAEAAGLLEEYTLDSIEQSFRSMLLLAYHDELAEMSHE